MSAVMLAKLRAKAQAHYLTDTCKVERSQPVSTDFMELVDAWYTVADGVACRAVRAGAGTSQMIEKLGLGQAVGDEYKFAFADSQDLQADDRITHNGKVYDVVRLEDDLSEKFFRHAVVKLRRGV